MEDLFENINEWSYQRFARFYGTIGPSDLKFHAKLSRIYNLIVEEKVEDLEFIAKESGCTLEECIMKIMYLKNKRKIGNYYINRINNTVKKCSEQDEELLQKYSPYIYKQHLPVEKIALHMPGATIDNLVIMKKIVYYELLDLYKRGLINGVSFDEVDKQIVYYSVEKRKNEKDTVTINCPNCGAINDVNRHGKARCEYCKSIIEDKQ